MSGGLTLKYLTIGLRRDKNLSDVNDQQQALNNLLDNFFTGEVGTSFISEDLDAIRGISGTDITLSKLENLANTSVKYTTVENNLIIEKDIVPLVTLKDRVENTYLITSQVPAILGGKGLNCRFIRSDEINQGTKNSTGEPGPGSNEFGITPNPNGIFDFKNTQVKEIFWAAGYFNFSTTIDPTFDDQYGGLQWTGWFAPSLRDPSVNIYISSTGLYTFEVDYDEDGNWETLVSVYDTVREVTVLTGGIETTTIELVAGDEKYIAEGDYWGSYSEEGPNIIVTSVSGSSITLDTAVTVNSSDVITVIKILGETRTRSNATFLSVPVGGLLKVRISAWWPDNGLQLSEKTVDFDYIGSSLSFYYMYSTKPNPPVEGSQEIREFLNNIITPYQNRIGTASSYKNFFVNNSVLLNFSPVSGFSQIVKHSGTVSVTYTDYNEIVTLSSSLSDVKIGDIIIPAISNSFISSLEDKIIVIKDDISLNTRIINKNLQQNITVPSYIVNHKGFIDWVYGNVSGNLVTVTVGNVNLLRLNYIVIRTNTPDQSWVRIISIDENANTFITSQTLGAASDVLILIYADRALIDTSKDIACEGVFGKEVASTVSTGAVVELKDVINLLIGQVVQFTGTDSVNPIIPVDTTIINISSNSITLSNNITGELKQDSTIVISPAGTTINVEACIVPANTAPPFIGTPAGLRAAGLGIRSSAATLTVKTNDLIIDVESSKISSAPIGSLTDTKVFLRIGGTQYAVLAKTV